MINSPEDRSHEGDERGEHLDNASDLDLSHEDKAINKEELKELILKFQDQQEKGYYTFRNWGLLHEELFGTETSPLPQTILNLWRVLKLINFGDDYIPTGLIYDTLVSLMLMASEVQDD